MNVGDEAYNDCHRVTRRRDVPDPELRLRGGTVQRVWTADIMNNYRQTRFLFLGKARDCLAWRS